jgi:glycosyltransferase involved in cell wall biosynthesis
MEQATLRLMQSLQAGGHILELLSLNPIGGLGPLLQEAGIPHRGLPYAGYGGSRIWRRLRRELKSCGAEALIMTGHHFLTMLGLGNFCAGHRVLAIHHYHAGVKAHWQWRLIYRLACVRFQTITYPSDFVRVEAQRIYPPVARLATTIRNPLVLPALPSPEQKLAARRSLGLPLGAPLIGNAGRLIRCKCFDVFLRTAVAIKARCPNAHFVIAGDGPERPELENLPRQTGLANAVTWLGWVRPADTLYQALDILLFNSDWDALPTTPQEAMAYGVPVVASVQNGGLSEILASGENGYLLPTHDIQALAGIVLGLFKDQHRAQAIGQAGRRTIASLCDPDAVAARYEEMLKGKVG